VEILLDPPQLTPKSTVTRTSGEHRQNLANRNRLLMPYRSGLILFP
jgi:hypothetical protein